MHSIFVEPAGGYSSRMFGVVVLLEDKIWRHLQLVGRLEEVVVHDAAVVLSIHSVVNEFPSAKTIVRHAAPNHHIATAKLDRSSGAAELVLFTGLPPHFDWPIGGHEVELGFV